jgi:hypothetical protein
MSAPAISPGLFEPPQFPTRQVLYGVAALLAIAVGPFLIWRPSQIAFWLRISCLTCIATSANRDWCGLTWLPTPSLVCRT